MRVIGVIGGVLITQFYLGGKKCKANGKATNNLSYFESIGN